jgi:hypothetical protein
MKFALRLCVVPLLLLAFTGMAKKPQFLVRFFVEANEHDTERFAQPIQLKYPPRSAFVERVPIISERDIKAIYPFNSPDGTWGCSFKLDPTGRLALENASSQNRGRAIVAFIGTQRGTHQVIDMVVDRTISDGIVTIQHGLTTMEMGMLGREFPDLRTGKKRTPTKEETSMEHEAELNAKREAREHPQPKPEPQPEQ